MINTRDLNEREHLAVEKGMEAPAVEQPIAAENDNQAGTQAEPKDKVGSAEL